MEHTDDTNLDNRITELEIQKTLTGGTLKYFLTSAKFLSN